MKFGDPKEKGISVDPKEMKYAPLFKSKLQPQMTIKSGPLRPKHRQSLWKKACLEDAKGGFSKEEKQLLHSILVKRVIKEESSSTKFRSDVITKKVLRMARHFFDMKIEEMVKYKKKKGNATGSFLKLTDMLVDSFFNSTHLRLLGVVSPTSLSNHLAAFV